MMASNDGPHPSGRTLAPRGRAGGGGGVGGLGRMRAAADLLITLLAGRRLRLRIGIWNGHIILLSEVPTFKFACQQETPAFKTPGCPTC